MTAEPTIIRASSAPAVLDCPRRWAGSNLADEIADRTGIRPRWLPTAVGAPIGTGVHALGAEMLRRKQSTGEPGPFNEARDAAMAALDEALEAEVVWDGTAANRNDAQAQVTRMGMVYATQIVPHVAPKMVEERLTASYAKGFAVSGQMDNLVLVGNRHLIRDTKTGAGKPTGMLSQGGIYSLLAQTHEWPVDGLAVDYIKRSALRQGQADAVTYELDRDAAEEAAVTACNIVVASVTEFRRTGEMSAFRPNPSSNLCKAKFCALHSTPLCRAHLPTEPEED